MARLVPVFLLLFLSCDESLPPLTEPESILKGSLVVTYTYAQDNQLTIQFGVTNEFDETLQGPASFAGSLQIASERMPGFKRTIPISSANILVARNYNAATRALTMDAGETVYLQAKWDFVDDLNRDLRDTVFRYVPDPTCPQMGGRKIALSEKFTITGTLLLYDRTGDVRVGPVVFSFCHIDSWVDRRSCPDISPSVACNLIQ